ncbi:hypothetical protein HMPREF1598_04868 [Escherichia coli 907710]|nr:hypothetical protein HMPREF9346_03784 [Escherichia coli MS 119-7]EFO58549.1 hypothetical protein HMPREF9348_02181 [Escherichia coli MS 145-7]ESA60921.1 hypothetical protein HMPREF1591_04830 [Escherichia coli 113303]ESC90415.1 hypothetical protein HMPREF1590_04664 [Escherichia coli 113302]ESD13792.1 hypothetical protein HMPREF1598_04868 [Escherichia coli 907710]
MYYRCRARANRALFYFNRFSLQVSVQGGDFERVDKLNWSLV